MRAFMAFLALALAAGCGGVRPQTVASDAVPASIYRILELRNDEHFQGWATPVTTDMALSVEHLVGHNGHGRMRSTSGGTVKAHVLWVDQERDLALYQMDTSDAFAVVPISEKPAQPQDEVFWRLLLSPGNRPSIGRGRVLGFDSEGDLQIDGYVAPGASGSALINRAGDLVGVVKACWNPLLRHRLSPQLMPTDEGAELLNDSLAVRSVGVATPVSGGIPKMSRH